MKTKAFGPPFSVSEDLYRCKNPMHDPKVIKRPENSSEFVQSAPTYKARAYGPLLVCQRRCTECKSPIEGLKSSRDQKNSSEFIQSAVLLSNLLLKIKIFSIFDSLV